MADAACSCRGLQVSSRPAAAATRQALHAVADAIEPDADLVVGDGQRRQQAHDIVAGRNRQQLLVAQRGVDLARWARRISGRASGRCRGCPRRPRGTRRRSPPAPACSSSALRATSSRKPSASTTSSTALPTAMASGLPPKVVPWTPAVMPTAASSVARQAPIGKPPPMPLAIAMMSGVDARPFIGEQLAGAADAALNLVEDQQQAVLVAKLAQPLQRRASGTGGCRPRPAPARPGSPRSPASIAFSAASMSSKPTWSKPSTFGPKPSRYFCLAAGGDGRQRAAVEGALEGDDAVALGMAVGEVVAPRRLDRAFQRLGARIGEEHLVGEGRSHSRSASRRWPGIS